MKRVLSILLIIVLAALIIGLAAAAWLWRDYQQFLNQPLPVADQVFDVATGARYPELVQELQARDLTEASWHWRLLGRMDERAGQIRAGEYLFQQDLTPGEILAQLAAGRVRLHRFTLIEGWTIHQLRAALAANEVLIDRHSDLDDQALMQALGRNGHPEGRFLPETYSFPRGHSTLDLLSEAARAMDQALEKAWQRRDMGLPLKDEYQLLIMASIIERETGHPDERDLVAGVFTNRLNTGMRLQTDPTVIYGLGPEFVGRLRRVHLRTDTPYNTYTRHGLPPTPIAMPGRDSLLAAAHPADTDYLYFVSRNDGSHVFSTNLADHNRAVNRYQRGGGGS